MPIHLQSPVFGNDFGAEVVDAAQFRLRVNILADIYDRLHGSYEQLQAELDVQKIDKSGKACPFSNIELDVKNPSRSCIIALDNETETKVHSRSPTTVLQSSVQRKYNYEVLRWTSLSHTQKFINEIQSFRRERERAPPSGRQQLFEKMLQSTPYNIVMACTIIFNMVLLILETDKNAGCPAKDSECIPVWIMQINMIFLGIYTLELFIVLDVYRWGIWSHSTHLIEAFIVFAGVTDLILIYAFNSAAVNVRALKIVRLLRPVRLLRVFSFFPELHHIIMGFAGAMKTMFWGFVTLMFLLLVMSLVAVEWFSRLNEKIDHDNEFCQEVFASVWNSVVFFFQTLAAGDNWGECTVPIIMRRPLSFIFFAPALISVQVGFMNLIMSVTMDRVSEEREKIRETKLHEKQKDIIATRKRWLHLFDQLERDGSGDVSLAELLDGFDSLPDFNIDLQLLEIERDDLPNLLSTMDQDGNKVLSADELLFVFDMVTHFDSKMSQVTARMESRLIGHRLESMIKNLQQVVSEFIEAQW